MVPVRECRRGTPQEGVACVCGGGGLRVEIEMDQLKTTLAWFSELPRPPRWMAAAAARANSCPLKEIGKNKLPDGGGLGGAQGKVG